jgi:DNA polymerase-3 subunit epsilon
VTAVESFLAIDFETANAQRASVCAVGWARFEGGKLQESRRLLVDPQLPESDWSGFNTSIHGIAARDVRGAPTFSEVWGVLALGAQTGPLVAHNASFDMGVLRAELARAGLVPDPFRYLCSARLARAAWPEMLSVSLPIVAEMLGIALAHHDPCSDATASGEILLAAVRELGAVTLAEMLKATGRQWGEVRSDLGWLAFGEHHGAPRAADMTPHSSTFDESHPLFGRSVAFTGALDSMTRREGFQLVLDVGGHPSDGVTKSTNLLVCGQQDIDKLAAGALMSHKLQRANELRREGLDLELVGEIEFLRML